MTNNPTSNIKRAQKESLYFRHLSKLLHEITQDDKRLEGLILNRVKFSTDKSTCNLYFYTSDGFEYFQELLEILKLYKPSIRKSLAHEIQSRYVPELNFKFDENFEKQARLEMLLSDISQEESNKQE